MRTIKLYFYGLLVLLFAIFILQNYSTLTYSVALRLNLGFISFVSVPLPLFLVAPLFFFVGLFLATIFGSAERRRLAREIKQLKGSRPELKPEPKAVPIPEPKSEVKPETNKVPEMESGPESRQEVDSKKKPEEGTIVSSGPLYKKAGSSEEPKPPFPS
jgi:uncharacterized integral membrane protein